MRALDLSTRGAPARGRIAPFSDETNWVDQIRSGNDAAFEAFFHAFYDDLVEFANLHVKSYAVSEEIIQDIFLSIWVRRSMWNPRGSLRAYLYGAARNKIIDHMRHRHVVRQWMSETASRSDQAERCPEYAMQYRELQQAVQQAVSELPERRHLIFKLSRDHDLTYAEIARLLGISINTVENQMVRAIKFLRDRLSVYYEANH